MQVTVTALKTTDFERVQAIEHAAAKRFKDIGMADVASMQPLSIQHLQKAARNDLLHGAYSDGTLVGFITCAQYATWLLIEELSVHPDAAGRRIGAKLIDHITHLAHRRGCQLLILSTFAHVPWNAPYYARLGFEVIPQQEYPAFISDGRKHEEAIGLDISQRVIMTKNAVEQI